MDSDDVEAMELETNSLRLANSIYNSALDVLDNNCIQNNLPSIDYVLVYNADDLKVDFVIKRDIFERNLKKSKLLLEHDILYSINKKFIKIHAPPDVLSVFAEVLKIKLPIDRMIYENDQFKIDLTANYINLFNYYDFGITNKKPSQTFQNIKTEYSTKYKNMFELERTHGFGTGTCSLVISFILQRQKFVDGKENHDYFGIDKLIHDGVYECAYPLHDQNKRMELLREFRKVKNWLSMQYIDNIKDYFGSKIALYFAWLRFYTMMLIPLIVCAVLCGIYGYFTWDSDPISMKICNDKDQTLMCPKCVQSCDYWILQHTCESVKMNYLIDNNATILFAFATSIWSILLLRLWKRYSAWLMHRWGLTGFSQQVEFSRPQFLRELLKTKKYFKQNDIKMSWRTLKRFRSVLTKCCLVLLMVCTSIIAFTSLIVFCTLQLMMKPILAGVLSFIVITTLDYIYSYMTIHITNLEFRRTQTEYDDSLAIKNYFFKFVNYYSPLFYIVLIKGNFIGYPPKYNTFLNYFQKECEASGCLMELCIQLFVIMGCNKFKNTIIEILIPYIQYKYIKIREEHPKGIKLRTCKQWLKDYFLIRWTCNCMFAEYLEMVIQYGFIILFGLACPLASLLAFINNIIRLPLDGIKILLFYRRPVAERANDIGVWLKILSTLTKIGIASNALIIAFSTNFIPKLVYKVTTQDDPLEGYLNFTLSYFNTSDFHIQPNSSYIDVSFCHYAAFRNPPWHNQPYEYATIYWIILSGRLAFIILYWLIISFTQMFITWTISDTPTKLQNRIEQENIFINCCTTMHDKMLQQSQENF